MVVKKEIIAALIAFACWSAVFATAAKTEGPVRLLSFPESKVEPEVHEFTALPADSDNKKPGSKTPVPITEESDFKSSIPLKKPTFRPVNRRFPDKGKHHHHHRQYHHPRRDAFPELAIASGENGDFAEAAIPRGEKKRSVKQHRRPHHYDSDSDDEDEREKLTSNRRKYHHRFHGTMKGLRDHNSEEAKHHSGGFMGTARKFLSTYF